MTTAVTVDAHAGCPVEVALATALERSGLFTGLKPEVVEPGTKRTFYIHSGMIVTSIRELERP